MPNRVRSSGIDHQFQDSGHFRSSISPPHTVSAVNRSLKVESRETIVHAPASLVSLGIVDRAASADLQRPDRTKSCLKIRNPNSMSLLNEMKVALIGLQLSHRHIFEDDCVSGTIGDNCI